MEQAELAVGSEDGVKPHVLRLELPWPPSANTYTGKRIQLPNVAQLQEAYYSGGLDGLIKYIRKKSFVQVYLTAAAKEFHRNIDSIVMRDRAKRGWSCPLIMRVWTYPPDRRKRDTSNLFKMLEDALQNAGVYQDDYQIVEHHAWRTTNVVQDGMVVVELEPVVA